MADKPDDSTVLQHLFEVIESRRGGDVEESYTAGLFAEGMGAITQKVGEEAVETIVAALLDSPAKVTRESADLLYHLLVLWAEAKIEPADVWAELRRREGTSGLAEKKSRSGK